MLLRRVFMVMIIRHLYSGNKRVDFFVEKETGRVLFNEINTIPGFTSISMYPKMMEAAGVPYAELCDRLLQLAEEKWS